MKIYLTLLPCLFCLSLSYSQTKFKHILITNDDGKEDVSRLLALAQAVKESASRVSVIVSEFDRSGFSNRTSYGKHQSVLEITCQYIDEKSNISFYTTPGYPADCVLLGLSGFFGEDRPDLVLSGINGGPNIGSAWFGSGTIGAVRIAAFLGVNAIAFSGFDDDNKNAFEVIPNWINDLIASGITTKMKRNSYLTVGFPKIPFAEIRGVKISKRKVALDRPELIDFKKIHGDEPTVLDNKTIWVLGYAGDPHIAKPDYDDYLLQQGYIIITPMTIDENNSDLFTKLQESSNLIPKFLSGN